MLRPVDGSQLVVGGTGEQTVAKGSYLARAASDETSGAAILVRGARDLVIDLRGVEFQGSPRGTALDACRGFGPRAPGFASA